MGDDDHSGKRRRTGWELIGPVHRELCKAGWEDLKRIGITGADADDVISQTIEKVHKYLEKCDPKTSLMALWMISVRRAGIDWHRRRKRQRLIDVEDLDETSSADGESGPDSGAPGDRLDFDRLLGADTWVECIDWCIEKMPDNQVLAMFAYQQVAGHGEIACRLSRARGSPVTEDSVRHWRRRGLQKVARVFRQHVLRELRRDCGVFTDLALDALLEVYLRRTKKKDRVTALLRGISLSIEPN